MLRKLKKAIPAVVSAVLCVTMLLGITASAASVLSETKALTSAKYYSKYITWAEKYSAKETKNTVTFGKSRTKKFYESQAESMDSKNPQFVVNMINKDEIVSFAMKDKKFKMVYYIDGVGAAMYVDSQNITMLTVSSKQKFTVPITDEADYDTLMDSMTESLSTFDNDSYYADELGIADNAKGKIFKFKSNEKIYYYEEFETENHGRLGFLFNSNGTPLAIVNDGYALCFSLSYKVDNSEFTIPKEYKEADPSDFDFSDWY